MRSPSSRGWIATTAMGVAVAVLTIAPGRRASAECDPCHSDEYLSGEDDRFCYCTKRSDRRLLEGSIRALEEAARSPMCVGPHQCNYFAAKVGELRGIPYLRDLKYPKKPADDVGGVNKVRVANQIYDYITSAVGSHASGWAEVTPDEAQELANRGKFVIGVARNIDPADMGHVAVVAPAQMPHAQIGSGPWIRDAQNPWSSVKASSRFGSSVVKPVWAVWNGPLR